MRIIVLVAFLIAPIARADDTTDVANFKGDYVIGKTLEERLMPDGKTFNFDQYTSDPGLSYLLGVWDDFGTQHVFRNGLPNPVNTLVWYTSLSSLADDLAANCGPAPKIVSNAEFAKALSAICQWPAATAKTDSAMLGFWIALMGYDAPESEYDAWKSFFLTSSYQNRPAPETVKAMTQAILLNPYFLIGE